MKVALPTHRGRISPLYDTAGQVVVVDVGEGTGMKSAELSLPGDGSLAQVEALVAARVERLVCGAISGNLMGWLLQRNLKVWPGVAGEIDEVVACLAAEGVLDATFKMPGCRGRGKGPGAGRSRWQWGWHAAGGEASDRPRRRRRSRCWGGSQPERRI
jgi:predicted Fe-Mo cluster-binding NifX family protein